MRLALAMALVLVAGPALAADTFSDVPKTHWAYDAIQAAVDAGVLQGYDGKFHGQRLLNRFQMAQVVDKLLTATKGGTVAPGPHGDRTLDNVAKLAQEFADELALLTSKTAELEAGHAELQKAVDGLKDGGGQGAGGLGFTAFASFALVSTDDCPAPGSTNGAGLFYGGYQTRYSDSPDTMFFTVPQVSLGVDKEVNKGVYFHAQFDYSSDVNGDSGVDINEAYFLVDELLGDIGAKVGAFALPYSLEHNGPFRTLNLTITPSFVNTMNESWRPYGIEFQRVRDVDPEALYFKVGLVSGTDAQRWGSYSTGVNALPPLSDATVGITSGEGDDGFGYYLQVGKKAAEKKGLGWFLGYFDNGGDNDAAAPHASSYEISFWQIGAEWWSDDFGVLMQYVDGELDHGYATIDGSMWYLLVNYRVDDRNDATLRYDFWDAEDPYGDDEGEAWTLAFNHKVTENSMFQFEWLSADWDGEAGYATDNDDDVLQLRYKVHF